MRQLDGGIAVEAVEAVSHIQLTNLNRLAREIAGGMFGRPGPGLHAAHRRSDDQSKMRHADLVGEEFLLQVDHVEIAVVGELEAQAVAWLAGFAVAHVVRQNDVVLGRSSGWPGANSSLWK